MHEAPKTTDFRLFIPVVLFVFNRPELTRLVFDRVRAARPERLFVVADGPRRDRPSDQALCDEVQQLIAAGVDWPCELQTDFADHNLGCGARVYSGLQWVFEKTEEAIILEDDCLPELTFFQFAQTLLVEYRNDPQVFMITGTNFQGSSENAANTYFFSRHCSIWGWATWRRALQDYKLDLSWWRTTINPKTIKCFCANAREHYLVCSWLDAQKFGQVSTWDIQWFAHVFFKKGFSIVPGTNLISNLGAEGQHADGNMKNLNLSTSPAKFPLRPAPEQINNDNYTHLLVDRHRPFGGWTWGPTVGRVWHSTPGKRIRAYYRGLKIYLSKWQIIRRRYTR